MPAPSIEGLLPALALGHARQLWWDAHYAELLAIYPERFVAVKDGEVVATNEDLFVILDDVHALGLRSPEDVSIEFVTGRNNSWLL